MQGFGTTFAVFTLYFILYGASALCPYECSCQNEPTSCPFGVRLAKDGCNCCNVCTRQQGQYCDAQNICDSEMRLVCDFASDHIARGICKVQVGKSCSYNGRTYLNGEMFQPTCKHQCWCMDGTVGCLSLCPHETRVPLAKECPNARLEVADDECCERWVCGQGDDTRVLPLDKFWDKYVDKTTDHEASEASLPDHEVLPSTETKGNSPVTNADDKTWDESELNRNPFHHTKSRPASSDYFINPADDGGGDGDEIIDYQMAQVLLEKGGIGLKDWFGDDIIEDNLYEYDNWAISNDIVGDADARRRNLQSRENCAVQTTSWSPCSKTCGLGLATRVTNNNRECKLKRDSRLCNIRPCDNDDYVVPKRGKHCTRQRREHKRTYFKYSNCKSVRAYRPRYCGGCNDGRCCTPHATRTVRIRFRCEKGEDFVKSMLMIRSCRCHNNCSAYTANSFLVSRDLHDDMHLSNEP